MVSSLVLPIWVDDAESSLLVNAFGVVGAASMVEWMGDANMNDDAAVPCAERGCDRLLEGGFLCNGGFWWHDEVVPHVQMVAMCSYWHGDVRLGRVVMVCHVCP